MLAAFAWGLDRNSDVNLFCIEISCLVRIVRVIPPPVLVVVVVVPVVVPVVVVVVLLPGGANPGPSNIIETPATPIIAITTIARTIVLVFPADSNSLI